jgi:hypothetical protein
LPDVLVAVPGVSSDAVWALWGWPISPIQKAVTKTNTEKHCDLIMGRLCNSLLFFLLTGSQRELAQQVQFLQADNRILRSKLPRVVNLTEREKQRLIRFGRVLGGAMKHLISVVSDRTLCCWLASGKIGKKPSVLKLTSVDEPKEDEPVGEVIRHRQLGGLSSHYERVAA